MEDESVEATRMMMIGTAVAALLLAMAISRLVQWLFSKTLPPDTVRPPHVQSWIPYLGSAIEMGKDVVAFICHYGKQFQSPLFTATIVGETCVFVADPELMNMVFKPKYARYLDSYSLQKDFVTNVLGGTPKDVQQNFHTDTIKIGGKQANHFILNRDSMGVSVGKVQDYFQKNIPELATSTNIWTSHSMFSMVYQAVFKATAGPLVSDYFVQDESSWEAFQVFDKGVIPLFNKLPSFLTTKARQARSSLIQTLQSKAFQDQASPLMKARIQELPVSPSALSKANLGLMFASVGNSAPAIYWCLLRLMEDPPAWEACRAQVQALVLQKKQTDAGTTTTPTFTMDDLDQMTLLESAFWETLRLYQGNFTARRITEDFVVETTTTYTNKQQPKKYLLEKGSRIMPFWAVLHYDPNIFSNPKQFQYDRFVGKPQFTFASGAKINFFPVVAFGGGEHLCPGRKFISYEARLLLALLMLNFDMRLAEGETIPGIDLTNIGVGVCHPEREVKVEIKRRQE
ncbi:25-hydroxycholesterol 7-alpha-hydroxylase (Fragment) [Seminavis robusta]|uniref:25-hydroxycholesterol 7-alpha-hydroxylase n=1 Tax=Seminavis robusta TaxID=568900 RepID=A0A9N8EJ36_9STRA